VIIFPDQEQLLIEPKPKAGFSAKSFFAWDDKRWRWKGRIKNFKLRTESGEIVAQFYRRFGWQNDGTMEIYELGKKMVDVIVMTFIMYLYRLHSEEAWRSASHGGGGGGGGGG
jgi:hypothetical protein